MAQQLKSPSCSCIGVQFGSQHSHVGLQPPVTSIPGDLMSSSDLHKAPGMYMVYIHTYIHACINKP